MKLIMKKHSFALAGSIPASMVMVAEPRLQMMYPFVTFWRLEQWRYSLLALVVLVGLLGIIAAVTAAVQVMPDPEAVLLTPVTAPLLFRLP
mgnify:CR=1 FL=1